MVEPKPRKEEMDSAEEMKKYGNCGNDIETSGAEPLSKDVSPQTDPIDVESSGAGPSTSKVASVEDDPTGASEVETSEAIPSSSMGLRPCSNLETVNRILQNKHDLDSSSNNEPFNTVSPSQFPGKVSDSML